MILKRYFISHFGKHYYRKYISPQPTLHAWQFSFSPIPVSKSQLDSVNGSTRDTGQMEVGGGRMVSNERDQEIFFETGLSHPIGAPHHQPLTDRK